MSKTEQQWPRLVKLNDDVVSYIASVAQLARTVGIDDVSIESNVVRGINDDRTVVLLTTENIPDFSFGGVGLNRIDTFIARYETAKSQDNLTLEAEVTKPTDDNNFVRSLILKGNNIKIDYRCANPTTIKAPRQINDALKTQVKLNSESVVILQRGQSAMMNSETVAIGSANDQVTFEIADVNKDTLKYTLTNKLESLAGGEKTQFTFNYPIKILLALFKQNSEGYFQIGQRGILMFPLKNLSFYVLPQS